MSQLMNSIAIYIAQQIPDSESLAVFLMDLVFTVIDIFFILRLYSKVYGKERIKTKTLYGSAAVLMLAVTCILRMILPPLRHASWHPVTVFCSFVFLRFYPSNGQKKGLYSGILLTVSALVLFLSDLIFTPMEHKNIFFIVPAGHLALCLIMEVIRMTDRGKGSRIPQNLWLLLLSISAASLIALGIIEYYIMIRPVGEVYLLTVEIPILVVFLFINLTLFVFFDRFSSMMHTDRENSLLEQQVALQNRHYKELEAVHDQIRSIHHDMGNFVRTATQLLRDRDGGSDELGHFLQSLSQELLEVENYISTGNQLLDSVLNIKIAELEREQIAVDTDIRIPEGLKLNFEQAVTIFGNLLDNAKEACCMLPEENRWLKLQLSFINGTLFARIENPAEEVKNWENGLPVSTKGNSLLHGIGLKNVKSLVEEFGTMDVGSSEGVFTVRIALYNL